MKSPRVRAAIAAVLAALVGLGAIITVTVEDDGGGKPKGTVTISVGKPAPGKAVDTVTVPAKAAEDPKASDVGDHNGLHSEDPAGASRDELEAAHEQQDALAQSDDLPIVTPDAAPSQRGCTTRLVVNFSSRRGVRPRLLVAHYTVSSNRPGWDDVWSVVSLFNRPAFQASSNYVIDAEGHCAYIVRESDKAWTQAAANPVAISVEIINSGHENALMGAAGYAKLGRVFADAAKRWAIPLTPGKVSGCTVVTPGIVDHHSLGACGGGHVDVSPYSIAPILAAARKAAGGTAADSDPHYLKGERANVECLQLQRRIAKRHGGWGKVDASHLSKASTCKAGLRRSVAHIKAQALKPGAGGWERSHRRQRYRAISAVIRG